MAHAMYVGTLVIEVRIEHAETLKDKRRVVRSIVDGARSRFPVSIAEVAWQNRIRSGIVGASAVSGDRRQVESILQGLLEWIEDRVEVAGADWSVEQR